MSASFVIIRRFFDIFCLFDNMVDPERQDQAVLVRIAREAFFKELNYVQLSLFLRPSGHRLQARLQRFSAPLAGGF